MISFRLLAGERYVYKFVCDPEALFNMAYGSSGCSEEHSSPGSSCRSSSQCKIGVSTALADRTTTQYYNNYQHLN